MNLNDFDFFLPEHLIAQEPAAQRDQSRMMVVWRKSGRREHLHFRDLPDILESDHFLVINNTRVFPARLRAFRPGKRAEVEILLVRELAPCDWLALVKPAKKAPTGQKFLIGGLSAYVLEARESGARVFRFESRSNLREALEKLGEPPLPPYIHRDRGHDFARDRMRYQTVYARHTGSVAAPTAGLHFTEDVFSRLHTRHIPVCEILLHVGYGTFQPVRSENIEEHQMEAEYYQVDEPTAHWIRRLKSETRRLVAVGTTTTRCLEFLAKQENPLEHAATGFCNLFIYPGFEFRLLNGLLTNFHLPRSTLFMLVCAFAGKDLVFDCYKEAISMNYRFFSYGDCMLII
jgi:S-adenosylmethionine:tRNA ribosyltransferase-isomerase